jgi:hypothetical protein
MITNRDWPNYLPCPTDDVFALGIVCLNYGLLEAMFRHLFSIVTRFNEVQTSALFHRPPNNNRQDALIEIMNQTTLPDKLKERVRYFCAGFKTCASNRHDLMHSRSGGIYTDHSKNERGLLFSKYSKAGQTLVCPVSLTMLRQIADEIHDYSTFGSAVISDIRTFLAYREQNDEDAFWQMPLRDRPPPPSQMSWRAEKDVLGNPSPPESFQG